MKLIRCCKRRGIKTVHEFMKKVAIYNNDGKLPTCTNTFLSRFEF